MKFNEAKHIYTNDEGVRYLSVTGFVKKFCETFDTVKKATTYAKKHKRKVDEVIAEWKKAGDDAIFKGNLYHKEKENELLEQTGLLIDDEYHPVFSSIYDERDGDKILNSLKLEPGIYPELLIWSDRYQIAGQADYVEITKSGKINIRDYKTSKEIPTRSFKRWDGTHQTMGFPFTHLEDCKFNQYALQINLYAYMIKSHNRNLQVGKLIIEHVKGKVNEDTGTFEIEEIIELKVPNMQDDIKVGLEYYTSRMQTN